MSSAFSVVKMMEMLVTKAKAAGVHTIVAGRYTPATIENAMRLGFDAVTIFVPDILNTVSGKSHALFRGFPLGVG